jgi:tRNA A37 threonylcarbamoyladenosine modification protein TsaB
LIGREMILGIDTSAAQCAVALLLSTAGSGR